MIIPIHPLQDLSLPICTVNEFGRLTYWNDGAMRLFGRADREVMGREWHSIVRTVRSPACCPLCQTRWSLRHGQLAHPVDTTLSINGRHHSAIMVPVPMSFDSQTEISFIILSRDSHAATTAARQSAPIRSHVRELGDGRIIDELTARERDILTCVVNGLDARAIGAHLGISHATARTYVQRILSKLGVHNKAQAVHLALTYNLIDARLNTVQEAVVG